jgi:CBS domain-containing protein
MKGHARNLMTERVTSVTADTRLADVARILVASNLGGVPVVDGHNGVVGFITETDLLSALLRDAPDDVTARQVMSHPPIVADEFMPTDEVLNLLREANIHHLPVVRLGRLVGIITPHDILRYCVERFPIPPEDA